MSRPHWMADLIACSWWPNDGPVLLRRPPAPVDDELDAAAERMLASKAGEERQRILVVLEAFPGQWVSTSAIAQALTLDGPTVVGALQSLRLLGAVEWRASLNSQRAGRWRRVLKEDLQRGAAE